ncbi:MAG: EamA family transporter [Pseudomonadota bacterium]
MSLRFYALAITVPLVWGMGIVFAKAALEFFPPILLMAFRFTVAALVLVWFVKPPWHLMGKIFLIALISAAMQYGFTFTGLKYLDASTTVLVVQLEVPVLVLLSALILKEPLSLRKVLGILLAFGGVALIAGEPRLHGAYWPFAMVIIGVLFWAFGQIMVRRLGEVGGFTLTAWVAVFATPQLFVASWLVESDQIRLILEASWLIWTTVVYLGLVMTVIGYGIWYHLLGKYPVNRSAPFLLLIPVFSILGSVLFLGESLTATLIAGGLVIVAGVAIITLER